MFRMLKSATNTSQQMENVESDDNDDDYEEMLVVADINGVLDSGAVSRAVFQNDVALRFMETDKPIVQIGSTLYGGTWKQTMGTDMVFKGTVQQISTDDQRMSYELLGVSSTRLVANKVLVGHEEKPRNSRPHSSTDAGPSTSKAACGSDKIHNNNHNQPSS